MNSWKEAFSLYREQFLRICIIILIFVFPIQFLYLIVTNYAVLPFEVFGIPLWTYWIRTFFMLITLSLVQLPFIAMANQQYNYEEISLRNIFGTVFKYIFFVYMVGILYSFLTVTGTIFFVLPGLIILLCFFAFPYVAVASDLTGWKGIKYTFFFGRKRFFWLLLIMALFTLIDLVATAITQLVVLSLTSAFLIINLSLMTVSALIIPLFAFVITFEYNKWHEIYHE